MLTAMIHGILLALVIWAVAVYIAMKLFHWV